MPRNDTSKRTRAVARYNRIFIAGLCLILAGAVWTLQGFRNFDNMVRRSSSPVGSSMLFSRSDATMKIAGLYTDESESVLIVRLSVDDGDSLKLPYKGSDYRVFIASDSLDRFAGEEYPVIFGRYTMSGDFFLVVPKPKDEVYTILVMNENFVATDDLASSAGSVSSSGSQSELLPDLSDEDLAYELSKRLNEYQYEDINTRSNTVDIDSDIMDIIGFRATIDPALDTDEYRVRVIPGTLLADDGQFDFEALFNNMFRDSAMSSIEGDYNRLDSQLKLYQQRVSELEGRYAADTRDEDVAAALSSARDSVAQISQQMDDLVSAYNGYASVTYKPSMFSDLEESAKVLDPDMMQTISDARGGR